MEPLGDNQRLNVCITTYLEPELIARIRAVDARLDVVFEPSLLGVPRYAADHYNLPQRTPEQEERWRELLSQADVVFDFDPTHRADLPELATRARWIQSTSAGIGQFVRLRRYDQRMPNTIFTTASGVHAQPLAEFCVMSMLMFAKGLRQMLAQQEEKHWERYAGTDLEGRTLGIVGVGNIGVRVAQFAKALGMTVVGTKRTVAGIDPATLSLDALYAPEQMRDLLQRSEYLVLVAPHTDETEHLLGAAELALLPAGAVIINIGRGALIDEPAMIAALASGHLRGAALDVFAEEPLPADSPLWTMPNVLVSPHSGSTSDRENARVTDLFCENLRRFLAGEELLNVLDVERLY